MPEVVKRESRSCLQYGTTESRVSRWQAEHPPMSAQIDDYPIDS